MRYKNIFNIEIKNIPYKGTSYRWQINKIS